jgi:hypothetical protein
MVNRLFKLFAMCFCRQEFVVSANLGVDEGGIDEEMKDFESSQSTFQIVCYVPLCVVGVLLFCISGESTLYDGNSKEILCLFGPEIMVVKMWRDFDFLYQTHEIVL